MTELASPGQPPRGGAQRCPLLGSLSREHGAGGGRTGGGLGWGMGNGRDDHLTSASSGASFPALALRSFQTSNSPTLVPPGERWRKRALPGNAGARLGGRCLLDRVSFGRRLLAASAAAAALGASTDPFLTLAEMRGHGVLPHRSTRKHSTPRPHAQGLRMTSGRKVCLGLRPAPHVCHGDLSELGKVRGCRDAATQCPRVAHPRPVPAHAQLARWFLFNPHSQVSVCSGTWMPSSSGGMGAQVPRCPPTSPRTGTCLLTCAPSLLLNPKSRSRSPIWKRLYLTCWLLLSARLFTEFEFSSQW